MEFDHTNTDLSEACGTTREEVQAAIDKLPDRIETRSEIVELLTKAGDSPTENLAVLIALDLV